MSTLQNNTFQTLKQFIFFLVGGFGTQTSQAGGLFGGTTTSTVFGTPTTSSAFGTKTPAATGFGATNQAGGGLFGASQAGGTSLFGGGGAAAGAGGLFGTTSKPAGEVTEQHHVPLNYS